MDKRVLSLVALAGASAAFAVLGFGCGSPLQGAFNGSISFAQSGGGSVTTQLTGSCQNGTTCTFTGQGNGAIHQLTINTSQCQNGVAQITSGTFTQQAMGFMPQMPTGGTTTTQPTMPAQSCSSQLQGMGQIMCNSNLTIQIPLFQQMMGTQTGGSMMGMPCQGQLSVTANRI